MNQLFLFPTKTHTKSPALEYDKSDENTVLLGDVTI